MSKINPRSLPSQDIGQLRSHLSNLKKGSKIAIPKHHTCMQKQTNRFQVSMHLANMGKSLFPNNPKMQDVWISNVRSHDPVAKQIPLENLKKQDWRGHEKILMNASNKDLKAPSKEDVLKMVDETISTITDMQTNLKRQAQKSELKSQCQQLRNHVAENLNKKLVTPSQAQILNGWIKTAEKSVDGWNFKGVQTSLNQIQNRMQFCVTESEVKAQLSTLKSEFANAGEGVSSANSECIKGWIDMADFNLQMGNIDGAKKAAQEGLGLLRTAVATQQLNTQVDELSDELSTNLDNQMISDDNAGIVESYIDIATSCLLLNDHDGAKTAIQEAKQAMQQLTEVEGNTPK